MGEGLRKRYVLLLWSWKKPLSKLEEAFYETEKSNFPLLPKDTKNPRCVPDGSTGDLLFN